MRLDATGVPQQGPHHEKALGRMAQVGCLFNPTPDSVQRAGRLHEARYVAGLLSLPEVGRQIRRECQAVGVHQADCVVALTDGGAGLQDGLQDALAGLTKDMHFILDFFHVSDHLREFASVLSPHLPVKNSLRNHSRRFSGRDCRNLLRRLAFAFSESLSVSGDESNSLRTSERRVNSLSSPRAHGRTPGTTRAQ